MNFIDINIYDLIDIILVTIIIYQLYKLIKGTVAIKIFIGITLTYLFWKIVEFLKMELLSEILGQFIGVGVIAIIIVFQQEIRRFLLMIGSTRFSNNANLLQNLIFKKDENKLDISEIIDSIDEMISNKIGSLIIIARNTKLNTFSDSGIEINSKLSKSLILSIFFKNSPLHDGAIIIDNNKILFARCVIPINENIEEIPIHFGLRHRAALSITELTDSIAITCSEERGNISYFKMGRYHENISINKLRENLNRDMSF